MWAYLEGEGGRRCHLCERRLFVVKAGVRNCPKGHQTIERGREPYLRVRIGKRG